MTTRKCYQCSDTDETLDEIRARRNEEIRAWGRQQLANADAALKGETEVLDVQKSDWDVLNVQPETPEQEIVEVVIEPIQPDVLALTEPQEGTEEVVEVETEAPVENDTEEPAEEEETEEVVVEEAAIETEEAPVEAEKEENPAKPAAKKPAAKRATTAKS